MLVAFPADPLFTANPVGATNYRFGIANHTVDRAKLYEDGPRRLASFQAE
jgi:hypothetical protein